MESENLYLVTIITIADSVITNSMRNYQWELKQVYGNLMSNWLFHFTVLPRRDLLRSIRHHPKQVFKGSAPVTGQAPLGGPCFLWQSYQTVCLTSNQRKCQRNPNSGALHKMISWYSSKI